jgi:hypothetical protein
MIGGDTPSKIIIVHGRKIIMDKGIGMNTFH